MASIEERLQRLEDRAALQDCLTAFCNAVDSLSDIDGLLNCFTEDAVFDLSGIHLPRFNGHGEIRTFFLQVFSDMTHHAHYAANFTINDLQPQTAKCQAAIIGMGVAKDGNSVLVYVRYILTMIRTGAGWKIKRLDESALMPLPKSLTDIHAR
jgi:ketosteroid isomerase-like protein